MFMYLFVALLLGLQFLSCHAILVDPLTTPIDGEYLARPPLVTPVLHFVLIVRKTCLTM
jgi:hypothetical protein